MANIIERNIQWMALLLGGVLLVSSGCGVCANRSQTEDHPRQTLSPERLLTAGEASSVIDTLSIGSDVSEKSHGLLIEKAARVTGGLDQPALQLLPGKSMSWKGGTMAFTLKVDPNEQNYLTVKLWGSDKGKGRLVLFANEFQVGYRSEGDYDALCQTDEEAEAPGRFIYETVLLPPNLTKSKSHLTLKIRAEGWVWPYGSSFDQLQKPLTQPSRGIYGVYIHLNGCFVPPADERQGKMPMLAVRPAPGMEVMGQSREIVTSRLTKLLTHPPSLSQITGRGESSSAKISSQKSELDKKQIEQQMLLLARAYKASWTPGYKNPKALDQIVLCGDWVAKEFALFPATPEKPWSDWVGAGPLGQAIVEVWPDIGTRMEETIEVLGIQTSRLEAWSKALRASVDFWRTHRRLYSNQSMIVDYNIYMANRALELINKSKALPEEQALHYLYEAVGLEPWLGSDQVAGNPDPMMEKNDIMDVPQRGEKPYGQHFYEITRKGLSRELGYVSGYGETILRFAHDIAVVTGDEKIRQQLKKIEDARLYFRYPGADADGYRCMKPVSEIDNRGAHFPLSGAAYNALDNRENWGMDIPVLLRDDPAAVGAAWQSLADNQYFANTARRLNSVDTLGMLLNIEAYEAAQSLPKISCPLPMTEGQTDFVFSDEENAVLAIKHGHTRLFVNLYFRAERAVNRVARVFELTPTLTRIATVRTQVEINPSGKNYVRPGWTSLIRTGNLNPPDEKLKQAWAGEVMAIAKRPDDATLPVYGGWGPFLGKAFFYQLRYGDYLIGLNTTGEHTFTLPVPGHCNEAPDLVSGKRIKCAGGIAVPPLSTVVLYLGSDR